MEETKMNSEQLVLRAIDSAVFDSGETAAGYLNPQIWSRAIEDFAKANLVVAPLGVQNTELLDKPGYILNIAKGAAITAAALTETDSITIAKPTWTQATVTPTEYGGAFQITRKEMDRAFANLIEEKAADAGYALALVKDQTIYAALVTGKGDTTYVNAKTVATDVASTDLFDTDSIANAISTMKGRNFMPKYLLIHPHCEGALMKSSQFVNAATYGGREAVFNGEIGKYLGVKIMSTSVATTTASTVTIYNSLLLGPRAFVVAQKRRPTIDSKYEPVDRAFTVAYVEDWGYAVLNAYQVGLILSS
jgi:N4-gp56 family major capsid protein